jgi:NTF2-like N-terminal transpeptidase domain
MESGQTNQESQPTQETTSGVGAESGPAQAEPMGPYQFNPYYGMPPVQLYTATATPPPSPFAAPMTTPLGQPAPWSMPLAGYPPVAMTPPPQKKRRKGLWITLIILLVVLALGGGAGAFTFIQYRAPQDAALQFCSALQHQDYQSAYDLFSTSLKGQYTQQVFTDAANTLDQIEGKVTGCAQSTAGDSYAHTPFGDTATFQAKVTRATEGNLEGTIHLTNENGSWKVARWDAALMGVNLNALTAATNFCSSLFKGDAQGVYGYFGSAISSSLTQADFITMSDGGAQIDGPVTSCTVISISRENTDSKASVILSVKRDKLGELTGPLQLEVEDGSWKITDAGNEISGTNRRPYLLATQYCSVLQKGDLNALYDLFGTEFRAAYSFADVKHWFTLSGGGKFTGCKYYFDQYKVNGDTATFEIDVYLTYADGTKYRAPTTLQFVLEGQGWKIFDFRIHKRS